MLGIIYKWHHQTDFKFIKNGRCGTQGVSWKMMVALSAESANEPKRFCIANNKFCPFWMDHLDTNHWVGSSAIMLKCCTEYEKSLSFRHCCVDRTFGNGTLMWFPFGWPQFLQLSVSRFNQRDWQMTLARTGLNLLYTLSNYCCLINERI